MLPVCVVSLRAFGRAGLHTLAARVWHRLVHGQVLCLKLLPYCGPTAQRSCLVSSGRQQCLPGSGSTIQHMQCLLSALQQKCMPLWLVTSSQTMTVWRANGITLPANITAVITSFSHIQMARAGRNQFCKMLERRCSTPTQS